LPLIAHQSDRCSFRLKYIRAWRERARKEGSTSTAAAPRRAAPIRWTEMMNRSGRYSLPATLIHVELKTSLR
ncbi:unnamed protein product, partial [Ectocarpus sp. 12 AP-2014]